MVFMNGLRMPHVWLVALSSILRTLERQDWAKPEETPTGRLLSFMASQIMKHIVIPAGSRVSPGPQSLSIDAALTAIFRAEEATLHMTVGEMSVVLRLLHRFGAAGAISVADLKQAMQARIATAIPQSHRRWLQSRSSDDVWADQSPCSMAALISSIYDTRVSASSGRHVPIAGATHAAKLQFIHHIMITN
jgi:hypothetical protein